MSVFLSKKAVIWTFFFFTERIWLWCWYYRWKAILLLCEEKKSIYRISFLWCCNVYYYYMYS